jgi:tetratricopeptide (TPR) repeat protein
VRPASQLIEQGIKAYTRGQLEEAERLWREALALEPLNDRARAYLDLLQGGKGSASTPAPAAPSAPAVPAAAPRSAAAPPAALKPAAAPTAAPRPTAAPAAGPVPAATAAQARDGAAPVALPPPAASASAPESGGRATLSDYAPSPWDQGPTEVASIVLDGEGGLDLATIDEQSDLKPLVPDQGQPDPTPAPAKPVSDVEVWVQGAKELHALGDFSGSLEMIEKILKLNPNHAEARAYLQQNESTLIAMYESKLGSMSSIPRLAIKPEEVLWLNLDHRAGFLLAQIDGSVNFEDLFALSGLPRLDTARILATLLHEGVIAS